MDHPNFTDAKFMSAQEKTKVYKSWVSLLDLFRKEGVPSEMPKAFSTSLYEHLHLHCGYIAHYDRHGFWEAQLGDADRAMQFMDQLDRHVGGPCFGANVEYRDLNQAMMRYARTFRDQILAMLEVQKDGDIQAQIEALQQKRRGLSGQLSSGLQRAAEKFVECVAPTKSYKPASSTATPFSDLDDDVGQMAASDILAVRPMPMQAALF